jgi:ribosomal protein L29
MDVSDMKDKPETSSVRQKKLEKDTEALIKKEFFYVYNAYAAFANAYEKTFARPRRRQVRIVKAFRMAGPIKHRAEEKHLDRAIVAAESWSERDKLCRRLASHCYQTAHWFEKNGDHKQAAKWMNLALRFLRLSMDPKSKEDLELVKKELAEVKAMMQEREEEDGED